MRLPLVLSSTVLAIIGLFLTVAYSNGLNYPPDADCIPTGTLVSEKSSSERRNSSVGVPKHSELEPDSLVVKGDRKPSFKYRLNEGSQTFTKGK